MKFITTPSSKWKVPRSPKHDLGDTPCQGCRTTRHKYCRGHLKDGTACSCSCLAARNYRSKLVQQLPSSDIRNTRLPDTHINQRAGTSAVEQH